MQDLPVDTFASICDLERRVAMLEEGLHGHTASPCSVSLLTRCYLEAHRVIRNFDPDFAAIWVASAYLWDARTFVTLGRHVHDPYPFRPFIAALDICVLRGTPDAERALLHLEAVGQDVLRAQGLELVRPRDTMKRLRLQEALERLKRL